MLCYHIRSPWCAICSTWLKLKFKRSCIMFPLRRTYKDRWVPIISQMNLLNTWHLTTTPNRPVFNQEVLDDNIYCLRQPIHSRQRRRKVFQAIFSVALIIPKMPPSNLRSSTTYPNHGFAASHRTMSAPSSFLQTYNTVTSHPAQTNFSEPGMLAGPSALAILQPQSIYLAYPTTPNILTSDSNHGTWHNSPSLHSAQYYGPVVGGNIIRHPSYPAMESSFSSSHTSQMQYPHVHHSHPTFSSQYTNQDMPFVVYPEISTSRFSPYNELSQQSHNSAIPQPGFPSELPQPMISLPLTAESSQIKPALHISDQPHSIPLHSPPSSPSLLSCRWLRDDTPCGFTGTLEALKVHCKISHFAGPPNAQIECRWEACYYHKRGDPTVRGIRRDCMWRHTSEVHLGMRRRT
ncbi:uncharacterized protein EDB91DRAFT_1166498 [Suillus paluster]|uniref:uncharacterized protein n=1 Tax=Suillus paluster TaxID=48578 RepID=UPI001B86D896|nr:uncharacterized protein EDB91DRAFT_1166498 [Suillus paluster]KAG1726269.1 hypothetical protein EDB91DRAFT_1166498 [Suillus paluster]